MTNNNWKGKLLNLCESIPRESYPNMLYSRLEDLFEDILTKKEQEHKAELESIAKKMKKKSRIQTTVGRDEDYEITVINLRDAISILDKHINK